MIGLEPGSIRTIYNGIPDVEISPIPRLVSGLLVVAVGRLSRRKGFDVLLRALVELPGVSLLLIGDGPRRSESEQLRDELGLGGRVRMVGWVDDARPYLGSADVLAVPSRWEAFPLVIPEAMLSGLPVVATNVGSIEEAVSDGETGFLVEPDDAEALASALGQLAGNPELRAAMGRRGQEIARERFTAAQMAAAFESLYEEILR